MGEEIRIFEYFVVAGVPEEDPVELTAGAQECGYKETSPQPPITDICIIFPAVGEQVPEGFMCIEMTPSGFPADLNHGSLRTQSCYLCYKRGFHKPPLVDIGVLYEGRGERVNLDSQMLKTTPYGRLANVNNANQGIYLTYRRAPENAPSSLLAVTDICIILTNKNEAPPHTFYKINKNLNKGMVGSDVYICYKKSLANSCRVAYKPAILDRFPVEDYNEYPLPPSVPIFGLPMGAVIECWPAKCQSPSKQFSTFVLTDQKGRKLYGAAVSFYENYTKPLTQEQLDKLGLSPDLQFRSGSCSDSTSTNDPAEQMTFHTNKSICLVSRYPFFNSFKRFLFWLHRMAVLGSYSLPIERYISHLMFEVPFPTARRPRVMVQVGNERILFDNPEDSPLPVNGASYCDTLRLLGAENYMYLMLLTLLEQKILIHSLRPWYLTSVAEALTTLIFPFHWQCPYIPQCPLDLAGVLHAPLPFVVGVDSRYFELYEDPPRDVTCVDLDTNTISQSEIRQKLKLTLLPRRAAKLLRQQLEILERKVLQEEFNVRETRSSFTQGFLPVEIDLKLHHKRRILELQIQETFLRFMILIMKGYQHYLKPIKAQPSVGATDLEALFDVNTFLRSRDKSSQEFYKSLVNTQLFIRFVEERSFLSDKDRNAYMAFFDECMEKFDQPMTSTGGALPSNVSGAKAISESGTDGMELKLLEVDENPAELENAVLFAPPDVNGNGGGNGAAGDGKIFSYYKEGFPRLDNDYFAWESLIADDRIRGFNQEATYLSESNLTAHRTRQEAKTALKLTKQQATSPLNWAKCLLSYAYSLWFIHLPSYIDVCRPPEMIACSSASYNKQITKRLRVAYDVLDRMLNAKLPIVDEVCFRIVIQVCGQCAHPLMAVKVFLDMKRLGIRPNAITYGFYNRAVLEAKWPSRTTLNAQKYWTKLRHFVRAVALFKMGLRTTGSGKASMSKRTLSQYSSSSADFVSQSSLNSHHSRQPIAQDTISVNTVVSNEAPFPEDKKLFDDDKRQNLLDQGYHSQATEEDSRSTGLDFVATTTNCGPTISSSSQHESQSLLISRSQSIPLRFSRLNLISDFAVLDELRDNGHVIASKRRKGSLNLNNLSSYDSSAGLLMTTDTSFLNDSVFDRSINGDGSSRNGAGGRMEPRNGVCNRNGVRRRLMMTSSKEEDQQKDNSIADKSIPSSVGNLLEKSINQEHENEPKITTSSLPSTSSASKLGNIPEELACDSDEITSSAFKTLKTESSPTNSTSKEMPLSSDSASKDKPLFAASADNVEQTDSGGGSASTKQQSPTRLVRTAVTENDPLNISSLLNEDVSEKTGSYAALTTPISLSASSGALDSARKRLQLDKKPFEDELSAPRRAATPGSGGGGTGLMGFSRFGRDSVRGLLNRLSGTGSAAGGNAINHPSAINGSPSKLIKSHTFGSGLQTEQLPQHLIDNDDNCQQQNDQNVSATYESRVSSPPTTPLTSLVNSALSKVDASDSWARLRTGVSSVVKEIKTFTGNLDQLGSPLRGSLSSLAMAADVSAAAGVYFAAMDMPISSNPSNNNDLWPSEPYSTTKAKDETNLTTGQWFSSASDRSPSTSGATEDLPASDPAFQLSSQCSSAVGGDIFYTRCPYDFNNPTVTVNELDLTTPNISTNGVTAIAGSSHFSANARTIHDASQAQAPSIIDVVLCSCTKCPHCSTVCYDDEIMAGWMPDDSELTTKCQFCGGKFVPHLTVAIRKTANLPANSWYLKTSPPSTMNRGQSGSSQSISAATTVERKCSLGSNSLSLKRLNTKTGSPLNVNDVESEKRSRANSFADLSPSPNVGAYHANSSNRSDHPSLLKEVVNRQMFGQQSGPSAAALTTSRHKNELSSSLNDLSPIEQTAKNLCADKISSNVKSTTTAKEHFVSVPFLCPIVLRKELETVVATEGDDCLTDRSFIDQHPIIFWNLLYTFQRIGAPTHLVAWLPYFIRRNEIFSDLSEQQSKNDGENVGTVIDEFMMPPIFVRCVYDVANLHKDDSAKPLLTPVFVDDGTTSVSNLMRALIIEHRVVSRSIVSQIIDYLHVPNLHKPIMLMINEHRKRSSPVGKNSSSRIPSSILPRHFSIYRDILLLALTVFGKDLRIDEFEREFASAFAKLPPKIAAMLPSRDRAPGLAVRACRKIFLPLDAY